MTFNLGLIMDEVASVLGGVDGIDRTFAYPVDTVTPPAAIVTYPSAPGIRYMQTYGQGETSIPDLEAHLIAYRVTDRVARDTASAWTANAGTESVVARLEAHTWTSCDSVTVTGSEFAVQQVGSEQFLDVIFHLDITGPGA
jgi:hypothetical protein